MSIPASDPKAASDSVDPSKPPLEERAVGNDFGTAQD